MNDKVFMYYAHGACDVHLKPNKRVHIFMLEELINQLKESQKKDSDEIRSLKDEAKQIKEFVNFKKVKKTKSEVQVNDEA